MISSSMVISFSSTVSSEPFDDTILSIIPADQTVGIDESFNIDINCEPGQPIKGYQIEISY